MDTLSSVVSMTLRTYIVKRIVIGIFILWLVATFNFVIFNLQVGDPVRLMLTTDPFMTPEVKEMLAKELGLGDPKWSIERYGKYLRNMFSFGLIPPYFGYSTWTRRLIAYDMSWRLGVTVFLLGFALVGRIILGIPTGVFAASKRGSKIDVTVVGSALFTWGVPIFFIQLLGIMFFGQILRSFGIQILSTTWTSPPGERNLAWWAGAYSQLALPIITLVLAGFGSWALYTRNMLVDALTQDYVVTARAKGLSERTVLFKHGFKSILPPIATMITLAMPGVVAGAIITETVFGIEGIGKWYVTALNESVADYGVTQAVLFVIATLVVTCNLIADLLYGVLDPRIRVGARR